VRALYLDQLRAEAAAPPLPQLRRYRIRLADGRVESEPLAETGLELPRIDYGRRNARPYRYVYGAGRRADGTFLDQIVKVDIDGQETAVWSEPDAYPGEPVFVAAPDGRGEDAGVLLSVVLDAAAALSFLLVLDAGDLSEVARARVPHHIPFGFHGQYLR
jgi:beta,beta-carotene 9',10'-dioxygenase